MENLKKCKAYTLPKAREITLKIIKTLKKQPNMTYRDAYIILDCAINQLRLESSDLTMSHKSN